MESSLGELGGPGCTLRSVGSGLGDIPHAFHLFSSCSMIPSFVVVRFPSFLISIFVGTWNGRAVE